MKMRILVYAWTGVVAVALCVKVRREWPEPAHEIPTARIVKLKDGTYGDMSFKEPTFLYVTNARLGWVRFENQSVYPGSGLRVSVHGFTNTVARGVWQRNDDSRTWRRLAEYAMDVEIRRSVNGDGFLRTWNSLSEIPAGRPDGEGRRRKF